MSSYWLGVLAALAMTVFVLELLRRGILRERFAALWLAVCSLLLIGAVLPRVLTGISEALGFTLPSNFLFFVAILFLLMVGVQLSFEVSRLESRTRRLAEDLALLVAEVRGTSLRHEDRRGVPPGSPSSDPEPAPGDPEAPERSGHGHH